MRRSFQSQTFAAVIFAGALAYIVPYVPPAYAGFEFTPPLKAAPAPQAAPFDGPGPVAAVPAAPVDAMPLPDAQPPVMPTDMAPHLPPPATLATAPSPGSFTAAPLPSPSAPMPVATLSVPPAGSPAPDFAIVDGFGSDIPLALAMRQIVPEDYAYSFDPSVNPGLRVNWNGGRPWDVVLDDALQQHGLKTQVQNNTVWVRAANAAPMPQIAQAQTAPTPVAAGYIERGASSEENLGYPRRVKPSAPQGTQAPRDGVMWSSRDTAREADMKAPMLKAQAEAQATRQAEMDDVFVPSESLRNAPTQIVPQEPAAAITRGANLGKTWSAAAGDSLHDTLTAWGQESGIQVYWNTDEDFKLPAPVSMNGSFTQAAETALSLYNMYDDRPVGRLYNQPDGTSVLIVDYYSGAVATN